MRVRQLGGWELADVAHQKPMLSIPYSPLNAIPASGGGDPPRDHPPTCRSRYWVSSDACPARMWPSSSLCIAAACAVAWG